MRALRVFSRSAKNNLPRTVLGTRGFAPIAVDEMRPLFGFDIGRRNFRELDIGCSRLYCGIWVLSGTAPQISLSVIVNTDGCCCCCCHGLFLLSWPVETICPVLKRTKEQKSRTEEALLGGGPPCIWFLQDLDTSKTSTRGGKEESKETQITLLVRHSAIIRTTGISSRT